MAENNQTKSGISTLSLLGVAFVGLKLCNVIDWSWWWITLPFWGGLGLVILLLILVGLIALLTPDGRK